MWLLPYSCDSHHIELQRRFTLHLRITPTLNLLAWLRLFLIVCRELHSSIAYDSTLTCEANKVATHPKPADNRSRRLAGELHRHNTPCLSRIDDCIDIAHHTKLRIAYTHRIPAAKAAPRLKQHLVPTSRIGRTIGLASKLLFHFGRTFLAQWLCMNQLHSRDDSNT